MFWEADAPRNDDADACTEAALEACGSLGFVTPLQCANLGSDGCKRCDVGGVPGPRAVSALFALLCAVAGDFTVLFPLLCAVADGFAGLCADAFVLDAPTFAVSRVSAG
jgi:hypothetical protein